MPFSEDVEDIERTRTNPMRSPPGIRPFVDRSRGARPRKMGFLRLPNEDPVRCRRGSPIAPPFVDSKRHVSRRDMLRQRILEETTDPRGRNESTIEVLSSKNSQRSFLLIPWKPRTSRSKERGVTRRFVHADPDSRSAEGRTDTNRRSFVSTIRSFRPQELTDHDDRFDDACVTRSVRVLQKEVPLPIRPSWNAVASQGEDDSLSTPFPTNGRGEQKAERSRRLRDPPI